MTHIYHQRSIIFAALAALQTWGGLGLFTTPLEIAHRNAIRYADEIPTALAVSHLPYKTMFSLGDPLAFTGLALEAELEAGPLTITSGYSLSSSDSHMLGAQTITVGYGGLTTSFAIDITNEDAIVSPLLSNGLFLSEFVHDDDDVLVEIFNGTGVSVSLIDYEIRVFADSLAAHITIDLPAADLADGASFVLSSLAPAAPYSEYPDLTSDLLVYDGDDTLGLFDKRTDAAIDMIGTLGTTPTPSHQGDTATGPGDLGQGHLLRSSKISHGTATFAWLEWRLGEDETTLGTHVLQPPLVTPQEQAQAYARYVMYGIGMNAANDYFNVFYELADEYGFMDPLSKTYLLENKREEITGINEEGRLVTNSFNDAIGRYNYLASKTGNPGLTSSSAWFDGIDFGEIGKFFLFAIIIGLAGSGYVFLRRRWRS